MGEMFANEAGDKMVAVIVALAQPQIQRQVAGGTGGGERFGMQLLDQEFIRRALINQQRWRRRTGFDQATRVVGPPGGRVSTEVGTETTLSPTATGRLADR